MAMSGERATADDRLSLDTIHDLLSARRRRYTLYCLYRYAPPMGLLGVADQVVEWEHGVPGEERLDERTRVYTTLYHVHVPKLAAADVVAYSRSEDMIELGRNAAQLRPYLERAAEEDLATDDVSSL